MNCLVFTYLDFDKQVIFHVFPQGKGLVRNLTSGKEREREREYLSYSRERRVVTLVPYQGNKTEGYKPR